MELKQMDNINLSTKLNFDLLVRYKLTIRVAKFNDEYLVINISEKGFTNIYVKPSQYKKYKDMFYACCHQIEYQNKNRIFNKNPCKN